LAQTSKVDLRIGTSGWSYEDWRGRFYPAERPRGFDELAYLARFFNAVEVNSSFYRPPTERMTSSWARRTPDDFLFTAKLWRRFTHERETRASADEIDRFRNGMDPLAASGKLGGLLAQFPWSFRATEETIDHLAWISRVFEGHKLFVEVRHASWLEPEPREAVASLGLLWANIDQPVIGRSVARTRIVTGRESYVRIHGRNYDAWFEGMGKEASRETGAAARKRDTARRDERYNYFYSQDELEEIAVDVEELMGQVDRLYLFANNHYQGKAAANAIELSARLTDRRVEAPDVLADVYPILKRVATPVGVSPPAPRKKPRTGRLF
jgi:uncharacterized protein YecE (DUF72 family)